MQTVLLAAVLSIATAQDDPPPPGGRMMRADANGDGVVTRDEHLAQAAERFDCMDVNRDGKLTADELREVGQRWRERRGEIVPAQ